MHSESIDIDTHDFSGAIDKQKHQGASSDDDVVPVTDVVAPSVMVTWPFAVMCGGIMAVGEMTDDSANCHEIMRDVSDQAYNLLSSMDVGSVITLLGGICPAIVISATDEHVADRRIIKNTWRCKRNGIFNEMDDVEVSLGLKSGRVVWTDLESRWLRYQ